MKPAANNTLLTIGQLAEQTGCNVPTIRYYEEIELIPAAVRKPSGHRVYGADTLMQLAFIRQCRNFGFSIEDVRNLLSLSDSADRSCSETREIAQAHLDAVRAKLKELRGLEQSLSQFVDSCATSCAGGPAPKCSIIQDIHAGPDTSKAPEKKQRSSRCCG